MAKIWRNNRQRGRKILIDKLSSGNEILPCQYSRNFHFQIHNSKKILLEFLKIFSQRKKIKIKRLKLKKYNIICVQIKIEFDNYSY